MAYCKHEAEVQARLVIWTLVSAVRSQRSPPTVKSKAASMCNDVLVGRVSVRD
jgi:hypothetical protein